MGHFLVCVGQATQNAGQFQTDSMLKPEVSGHTSTILTKNVVVSRGSTQKWVNMLGC